MKAYNRTLFLGFSLWLYTVRQRVFYDRGPGFLAVSRSYDLAPRPPTPSRSPVRKLDRRHKGDEKERQLFTGGEGGGRGTKSYDREEAWPSINHTILSGVQIHTTYKQKMDVRNRSNKSTNQAAAVTCQEFSAKPGKNNPAAGKEI
jgi:hypothetical protein